MKNISHLLFALLLSFSAVGQVITVTPEFPQLNDSVTIVFNAGQGNAALNGFSGPVYIHTGLITDFSGSAGDWKFIKTPWPAPDSTVLMTGMGNNQWRIRFKLNTFYGCGTSDKPRAMAMVFRNAAGTQVGKNADGSDVYYPIYGSGFTGAITSPIEYVRVVTQGQSFPFTVKTNQPAFINLYRNNQLSAQQASNTTCSANIVANQPGKYWLKMRAETTTGLVFTDSMYYVVRNPPVVQDPPAGMKQGINYLPGDTAVVLMLKVPFKDHVFVIGDWNNWEIAPQWQCAKSFDGDRYWIRVGGLTPGTEYRFQYVVDDNIRIGDPYCDKVLEQGTDNAINPLIYPNLIPFPNGKTYNKVSVFQPGQTPFNWQVPNFQKPDSRDLVVYELLVRDFVPRHDFKSIIDSIKYLKNLKVNAVEFMPWGEFEGNNSWGYGPTYFTAVDKYYGPKEKLKELIDTLHKNGIAVILDVVFNHCFGQSPYATLFWDQDNERPSSNSPYCNPVAKHPFNVGFDFNHDSPYVQEMVDSVLSYWVKEYKVDGFRFDLSKGFTQFDSGLDVGLWSQYDQSRVNHIQRIVNKLWARHPGTYAILEHLGNNDEETVLCAMGCMLWGKATFETSQAAMGFENSSNFEWGLSYKARNWPFHNLVGYAESHDEERIMYTVKTYGNANGNYSTRTNANAMQRMAQLAPYVFLTPGPKMLWQFGELGYDISIDFNGRTGVKPNRWWEYYNNPDRHRLYKTYAAFIKLKQLHPSYRTSNYNMSVGGKQKQLYINDAAMNTCVFGNFDVVQTNVFTGFQHTGTWYDYLTGAPLQVNDVNMTVSLQPGQFKVYTDQQLPVPDMTIPNLTNIEEMDAVQNFGAYPNPFEHFTTLTYALEASQEVELVVSDALGRRVKTLFKGMAQAGPQMVEWDGETEGGERAEAGVYLYQLKTSKGTQSGKIMLMR